MTLDVHPFFVFGAAGLNAAKISGDRPIDAYLQDKLGERSATRPAARPWGEFAFVIVSVAISEHLVALDTAGLVLFITALTMATVPLMSRLGEWLAPRFAPKAPVDPHA